jgi:hypothetical protein
MRETLFDDYNETCDMRDCSVAIYSLNFGLLMVLAIFCNGHFGHAKQCVIIAFDTNYMLSTDDIMASTLHLHKIWRKNSVALIKLSHLALRHPSPRLWMLAAASMADVIKVVVVVALDVDSRTSGMHAAIWTTSCRHVRPRTMPS